MSSKSLEEVPPLSSVAAATVRLPHALTLLSCSVQCCARCCVHCCALFCARCYAHCCARCCVHCCALFCARFYAHCCARCCARLCAHCCARSREAAPRFPSSDKRGSATRALSLPAPAPNEEMLEPTFGIFLDQVSKKGLSAAEKGEVGPKLSVDLGLVAA